MRLVSIVLAAAVLLASACSTPVPAGLTLRQQEAAVSQPLVTGSATELPTTVPVERNETVLVPAAATVHFTSAVMEAARSTAVPVPTATPPATAAIPTGAALPVPRLIVGKAPVNVRSGPGLVYPVIGALQVGERRSIIGRDPQSGWWQVEWAGQRGWVSALVVTAEGIEVGVAVVTEVPPTPTIRPTTVPTATAAPSPIASVSPTPAVRSPSATAAPAVPPVPVVVAVTLESDTKYPVRAQRFLGWGYEIVDASQAWDISLNRDVYGAMAHAAWGDTLYQRHKQGIRVTIIDAATPAECVNSAYPQYSPVLAPIQLANWSSGCKDRSLPLGFGDGEGAAISVGCARDKPGAAITVQTDPEECFVAIRSGGAHLNDIVITGLVVAYNLVLNTFGTETPDLAQAPFTPALGKAHKEGDQWRWDDPFITIVSSAQ